MSSFCKACKAEIVWGVAEVSGKPVPLNAHSEQRFIFLADERPQVRLVTTWQSHFATCPAADEFRKRTEGTKADE